MTVTATTLCEQPLEPPPQKLAQPSWPHKVTVDISSLLKPKDEEESLAPVASQSSPPSPASLYDPASNHFATGPGQLRASSIAVKRPARTLDSPSEPPAKRQSKWSPEEDAKIIQLRGDGMKWEDISKHLPGRSAISCRLHYQNYLERRSEWDEDRKNKLARLYERFKADMWAKIAEELAIPWRAAEAMHWQMGENEMASRAGVTPFSITTFHSSSNHLQQQQQQQQQHHHHHHHQSAGARPLHYRSNSATSTLRPGLAPQVLTVPQLPSLAELTAGLPAHSPHAPLAARPQSLHAPHPPSLYPSPVSLPAPPHIPQTEPLHHLSHQKTPLHFPLKP